MKAFNGFKKRALTDELVLLAAGGHKALSDFFQCSGGTITGTTTINDSYLTINATKYGASTPNRVTITSGLPFGSAYTSSGMRLYSNGIGIRDPYCGITSGSGGNDAMWIRMVEETANSGYAEIATGDDGTEPIYIRLYNTSSAVVRTATILDGSGNTSFPGTVSGSFSGSLSGTSTLTTGLLGSGYTSGNSNIIKPFWNTKSDNRWYLQSADLAYQCRVDYATSSGNSDTVDGYHASNIMTAGWVGLMRTGGSSSVIKWTRVGRFITTANDNVNNDAYIEFFANGDLNYTYYAHGKLMCSSYGGGSRNIMLSSISDGAVHLYATIDANSYIWIGHNAWWTGNAKYRVLWSGSYVEWYTSDLTSQTSNPNETYVTDNGVYKLNSAFSSTSGLSHLYNYANNLRVAYATLAESANAVAWASVTGKPSTFTPSSHTHNYASSLSAGGPADYVRWESASANANRCIPFAYSDSSETTSSKVRLVYNDSFKYNPNTNVLTVGSITGNAATATYATRATYLYADNSPYRYGDSNPYYVHVTWNTNADSRWYLRMYPETPKTIAIDYAYSAGNATYATSSGNADTVDGFHYNSFTYTQSASYNRNGPYYFPVATYNFANMTWGAASFAIELYSSGYANGISFEGKLEVLIGHWTDLDRNPTITVRWIVKGPFSNDSDIVVVKDLNTKIATVYMLNNRWDCTRYYRILWSSGWSWSLGSYLNLPTASSTVVHYTPSAATYVGSLSGNASSATYATSAGSAPASDVYSWAKASSKPSYSWSEIGSKPISIEERSNNSPVSGAYAWGTYITIRNNNNWLEIYAPHTGTSSDRIRVLTGWSTDRLGWKSIAWTTDIPTLTSLLTNNSGYLTSHLDISGKVDKSGSSMTGVLTWGMPTLMLRFTTNASDNNSTGRSWYGIGTYTASDGYNWLNISDYWGINLTSRDNAHVCINGYVVCHAGNISSYAITSHQSLSHLLPLSGGTITGNLYVNLYIGVNAWSGYGSGACSAWYNGNTTHLVWDKSLEAPAFYASSDIRLKKDIINESKSIRSFRWKDTNEKSYGLIALELEEQGHEELVSTKADGYKTVNYNSAMCMIIGQLENRIEELENKIRTLEQGGGHMNKINNVEPSNNYSL